MEDHKTISWIFLAAALASQISPTDFAGISMMADGINHAVPTHKELQNSIKWLMRNNLLAKYEHKYSLTEKGKVLLNDAKGRSHLILQLWHDLELTISKV